MLSSVSNYQFIKPNSMFRTAVTEHEDARQDQERRTGEALETLTILVEGLETINTTAQGPKRPSLNITVEGRHSLTYSFR